MRHRGWRMLSLFVATLALGSLPCGCGTPARHSDSAGEAKEAKEGEKATAGEGGAEAAVELSDEGFENAGIEVGAAGPAAIEVVAQAPGEVHLNAERLLEIRPRYAGVLREIRKSVGDRVSQGEVVAVIQSNESLTDYELTASMAGNVIARGVVTGQSLDHEDILMTVADLSTVWVDFAVYPQYVGRIRPGMAVTITAQNRPDLSAKGRVHYVGPVLTEGTRVSSARVLLSNPKRHWQPGLFVTARVVLDRNSVPIAVPTEAIIRSPAGPAVFRVEGLRFELQPVTIGRSDRGLTEIRQGLAAGDSIVTRGAFILKSELGKGEVEE